MTHSPLQLVQDPAVYPVRQDTLCLADAALRLHPRRALDLGSGTGYIAILLAQHGSQVEAVDIQPAALACTRANAAAQGVAMAVYRSDLLVDVSGRFDLICYNGSLTPGRVAVPNRWKPLVWRRLNAPWLRRLMARLTAPARQASFGRLLAQARAHLDEGGTLLLHILDDDLARLPLRGWRVQVLDRVHAWSVIAALQPDAGAPAREGRA